MHMRLCSTASRRPAARPRFFFFYTEIAIGPGFSQSRVTFYVWRIGCVCLWLAEIWPDGNFCIQKKIPARPCTYVAGLRKLTRLKGASFPKDGHQWNYTTSKPQNLDPQKGFQNSKSTVFVLLVPTLVGAKSSSPTFSASLPCYSKALLTTQAQFAISARSSCAAELKCLRN